MSNISRTRSKTRYLLVLGSNVEREVKVTNQRIQTKEQQMSNTYITTIELKLFLSIFVAK